MIEIILMTQLLSIVFAGCPANCEFGCIEGSCYGKCLPGYLVNVKLDKYVCEECQNQCLECGHGYYQQGRICQPCMKGCKQCIIKEKCSCEFPCLTCNSNGCQECASGYFIISGVCIESYKTSTRQLATYTACDPGFVLFYITSNDCTTCDATQYCSYYDTQYMTICLAFPQPLPAATPVPIANCSTCTRSQCMLCTLVSSVEVCYQCQPKFCVDNSGFICSAAIGNYCDSASDILCNLPNCTTCPTSCSGGCAQGVCYCAVSGNSSITSYMLNNNCRSCSNGYYLSVTLECSICQSICQTCTSGQCYCLTSLNLNVSAYLLDNSTCTKCLDGYYQSTTSQCIICPSTCKTCNSITCLSCNSPCATCSFTSCLSCISSYYLSGSSCLVCDSSCLTCISTQCLTCAQTNYYPAAISTTNNCLPCNSTCLTCTIDACQTCITNYYLIGNFCCNLTCASCTTSACLTCVQPNYYLSGMKCLICDSSCSTCNSSICLTCVAKNMYVSGTQCLNCNSGCSSCTSTQCLVCYNSNQYPQGTNCINCPAQCKSCNGLTCSSCQLPCTQCNMTKCLQCDIGYFIDSQNRCMQCQPDCQACNLNGCLTCKTQSHQLINFQCILCDANCSACIQSSIIQEGQCLQCNQTYYLNQYGGCQQCPPNCLTCLDSTTCIICSNPIATIQSNCLCTQSQFQQSDLSCVDCQYPCTQCKSQTYCSQCAGLVGLQLYNFQCICSPNSYQLSDGSCQLCQPQCETCNVQGCLTCQATQYRTLSNNKCICQSGYIDIQQDICLECSSPQGQITQQCQYNNCGDGYWTYGEECDDGNNIIRDGCSNCQIDKQSYCINTILQPSSCYKCEQNCLTCDQSGCLSCHHQYKLIDMKCKVICPDNCLFCTKPNICDKCLYLYELTPDSQCQIYVQNISDMKQINPLNYDIKIGGSGQNNSMPGLATLLSQKKLNNLTIQLESGFDYQLNSISIDIFNQSSFTYQYNFSNGDLNLNFTFEQSIQTYNLIHLLIKQSLQNTRILQSIQPTNETFLITVIPNTQAIYTEDQMAQIAQVQQIQTSLTSALSILGPLTVLFGGFGTFMNILQIVAWVSNLYYINVNYPGNVETFFQYMSLNSIFQLPNILTLNQSSDDYYRATPQRFNDQGYDPLFMNNMQQIILVTFLLISIKPLLILYRKCIEYLQLMYMYTVKARQNIQKLKILNSITLAKITRLVHNRSLTVIKFLIFV